MIPADHIRSSLASDLSSPFPKRPLRRLRLFSSIAKILGPIIAKPTHPSWSQIFEHLSLYAPS